MKKSAFYLPILGVALILTGTLKATGIDTQDTKLMTQPAVSDSHIAFVYANDLWVADLNG